MLEQHAPDTTRAPATLQGQVRHEESDIRVTPVLVAVAALGIVLALVATSAERLLHWREQRAGPAAARPKLTSLPAEPRLEPLEPQGTASPHSYAAAEAERRQRLQSFGPADEEGFVHIPIDAAMRQLAGKLDSHSPSAQTDAESRGLLHGGESNSGRVFQKERP